MFDGYDQIEVQLSSIKMREMFLTGLIDDELRLKMRKVFLLCIKCGFLR